MTPELTLDLLRGPHLLGVVIGMGAAIYYDLRTVLRLTHPLSPSDTVELRRIHMIVLCAFAGIWISGLGLIGYRTGFDAAVFTPKLWSKVIVVATLTLNSAFLSAYVIPNIQRSEGIPLIGVPARKLLMMSLSAGLSMSCWLLALTLGFSTVLKTASWDLLIPVILSGVTACISGVLIVVFGVRLRHKSRTRALARA
ncbi:hypothetical protein [Yoonia sp. 208BN28-4]|uniref:hypothetical protein n=1 Tax=Yoonia sp. 208BN28-4 TaxID=3126505 RepID=UPI00309720CC